MGFFTYTKFNAEFTQIKASQFVLSHSRKYLSGSNTRIIIKVHTYCYVSQSSQAYSKGRFVLLDIRHVDFVAVDLAARVYRLILLFSAVF